MAETLLNPFGEDDDDFDTYYLIDRNLQVGGSLETLYKTFFLSANLFTPRLAISWQTKLEYQ